MKFEKGWVEPLFFLPGSDLFERAFLSQIRLGPAFLAKCQYGQKRVDKKEGRGDFIIEFVYVDEFLSSYKILGCINYKQYLL